ncbi:hypothetical protein [Streptomyces sp. NBC_01423]|uniref:hypothetical protein n=1 Tax=Streptomyces sp. NBC_01423 TaxID=2903860 RepID=UPI002E285495|nr:hypothetical protein [Streptomyces sp. NBC_01423]
MLENLGRYDGAHSDYCKAHLCCRCQQRTWTTRRHDERLCGLCASCCTDCGRAPAAHLEGLTNGICAECLGRCPRCGNRLPETDACPCRTWKRGPGNDPVAFIMQGLPQPLLQALGHRLPHSLREILSAELTQRTPAQLLARVERRWHTRWSHAIHERDEDNRRRWAPQEIVEHLVRRGSCRNPDCEDGYLIHDDPSRDDTPCGYCQQPEHRFVPGTASVTSTSDHARRTAAQIRQALRENRTDRKKRPGLRGAGSSPPVV